MKIEINKKEKHLRLIDKGLVVFDFECVLGKNDGFKQREGDNKTPEGEYKVVVKNDKSKYYLSLGLNYPNIEDAEHAFKQGIIDKETADKIIEAQNTNGFIPWNTALGGVIYIHGQGNNFEEKTEGCIKLKNCDIKRLFDKVNLGVRVLIK